MNSNSLRSDHFPDEGSGVVNTQTQNWLCSGRTSPERDFRSIPWALMSYGIEPKEGRYLPSYTLMRCSESVLYFLDCSPELCPIEPPIAFPKGRGGGFSINSRLGIRSCNSSLFKWSLSPGHVPFANLAGGEGSGRRSYARWVSYAEIGEHGITRRKRETRVGAEE